MDPIVEAPVVEAPVVEAPVVDEVKIDASGNIVLPSGGIKQTTKIPIEAYSKKRLRDCGIPEVEEYYHHEFLFSTYLKCNVCKVEKLVSDFCIDNRLCEMCLQCLSTTVLDHIPQFYDTKLTSLQIDE